ncbi:MAG: hypothetical protein CMC08_05730 [Flavobacteriaceae bacterium]|nr:hypothetical protein [Flavobacteriaceae bacterium]
MERDGTNVYQVKIKYAEVGLQSKSSWKRKGTKKTKKMYIMSTPSELERKLGELECSLHPATTGTRTTLLERWFREMKSFCENCSQTYFRVLRS